MSEKNINTLVKDIYGLFHDRQDIPDDVVAAFGQSVARVVSDAMCKERQTGVLRMSNIGNPCERKLWNTVNEPEGGEPLTPETRIKFLFGHILEELLLFLAGVAGHTVTRQQEEVEVSGVKGHIDAFIDGHLVDSKSASSYSFTKFAKHQLGSNDSFGYIGQLGGYAGSLGQQTASFLVIDKQHGHITLDTHDYKGYDIHEVVERKKKVVENKTPPPRGFPKSSMNCRYCDFNKKCWG